MTGIGCEGTLECNSYTTGIMSISVLAICEFQIC